MPDSQWLCSMIGAREHYAVPRALHASGSLYRFYTDAWAGPLLRRLNKGPAQLRALASRYHPDLPPDKVVSFTRSALLCVFRNKLSNGSKDETGKYLEFLDIGREFARRVNAGIERLPKDRRPAGFFGYNTGSLETLQLFRDWSLPGIVNQIDAGKVHEDICIEEETRWPGWQAATGAIPAEYWQHMQQEWAAATRVVVNSEWSMQALVQQGVPGSKIEIVPLAFEAKEIPRPPRPAGERVVLFLGRVILSKGIQYLFETARLLAGRPIRFVVAGPIGISPEAASRAPANVTFFGPVTRDRIGEMYRNADLFVLPTVSDGFAITQLEAMAHGLPVIATPNCARVVTDGEDGRIVPARDPQAMAAAIEEFVSNPEKLASASRKASETVKRYSLQALTERLSTLLAETRAGFR